MKYTIVNDETGEIVFEGRDIEFIKFKKNQEKVDDLGNEINDKREKIMNKTLKPFIRMSVHPNITDKIDKMTYGNQAKVYRLLRSLGTKNRVMYGENPQQYCRTFNDLNKIEGLNMSERSLKDFRLLLIKNDFIREVTLNIRNEEKKKFLLINPLFACNGSEFDPIIFMFFKDVIKEYGLLNESEIEILSQQVSDVITFEDEE